MERQDVGMAKAGGELDFAQKSVGTERRGELGSQHLDRDRPVVLQVLREVYGSHAATTELPVDVVATGEGGAEAVEVAQARGSGRGTPVRIRHDHPSGQQSGAHYPPITSSPIFV